MKLQTLLRDDETGSRPTVEPTEQFVVFHYNEILLNCLLAIFILLIYIHF